jgi:hypothetical protein
MLIYYSLNKPAKDKPFLEPPPLLQIDAEAKVLNSPDRFQIGNVIYSPKRKAVVCPHIPIDCEDEESCYAIQLMHFAWPDAGEAELTEPFQNAVAAFTSKMANKQFPDYVKPVIDRLALDEADRPNQTYEVGQYTANTEGERANDENNEFHNSADMEEAYNENEVDHDLNFTLPTELTAIASQHLISNIPSHNVRIYKKFLTRALAKFMRDFKADNASAEYNSAGDEDDEFYGNRYPLAFKELPKERQAQLAKDLLTLRPLQRAAYEQAMAHISGKNSNPLSMFLTGEGGTGKSKVIKLLAESARLF